MKKLLLVMAAFAAILPMNAFARGRVAVFVGPSFAPYGYGWYGPSYAYGMYPYGPYFGTPNAGQVKVDTKVKDAEVLINGSYAGTVGELKTMTMRPGNYNIEVRSPGRAPFMEHVYVIAGKTVKLHPDLQVQTPPHS